ncbi:unnamed protein product, partial [Meganyctiphanes norvegica]
MSSHQHLHNGPRDVDARSPDDLEGRSWPGPVYLVTWMLDQVTAHTGLLMLLGIVLYIIHWVKHRRQQQSVFQKLGIPFVPPNLITGSQDLFRKYLAIDIFDEWISKYGKVFGYYVGWSPTLVVADLDLVQQILIKDFVHFANRPKLVIDAQPVVDTVVGLRDQRWKDVRSILAPTFSMLKMKHMTGIMNGKVDELLRVINERATTGQPIEWYSTFQGLTLDVISECALAIKSDCQQEQNKNELFRAVRGFLKNALNPAILMALYFPSFAKILSIISNKFALSGRMTEIVVQNLKKVIAIRRNDLNVKTVDVLQLMMDSTETPMANGISSKESPTANGLTSSIKTRKLLTDKELIANIWIFLLGGFETTADALTYTTYLLALHPQIQERLYNEVAQVTGGSDQSLTYEEVSKMTYLEQVFNESLRLYPPVVTFVIREARQDVHVGNLFIPKDMSIIIPIWQIHRDPEHWPNPETFDPERYWPGAPAVSRKPERYLGSNSVDNKSLHQTERNLASTAFELLGYEISPCPYAAQVKSLLAPMMPLNP